MTPAEAAVLLSYCASFDQRTIGEADARAWAQVLSNVTLDEARAAVEVHYGNETTRVMPAQIRKTVVATRNERFERKTMERLALTAGPTPTAEQRGAWVAAIARVLRGVPDDEDSTEAEGKFHIRRKALTVTCPWCEAKPHIECNMLDGPKLRYGAAHPSRIAVANGENVGPPSRTVNGQPFIKPLDRWTALPGDPPALKQWLREQHGEEPDEEEE